MHFSQARWSLTWATRSWTCGSCDWVWTCCPWCSPHRLPRPSFPTRPPRLALPACIHTHGADAAHPRPTTGAVPRPGLLMLIWVVITVHVHNDPRVVVISNSYMKAILFILINSIFLLILYTSIYTVIMVPERDDIPPRAAGKRWVYTRTVGKRWAIHGLLASDGSIHGLLASDGLYMGCWQAMGLYTDC